MLRYLAVSCKQRHRIEGPPPIGRMSCGGLAAAAGPAVVGAAASSAPEPAASNGAATASSPATDNVLGAVGNFFGSLFGKH